MKPTKFWLFVFRLAVIVVFAAVTTLPLLGQGNRSQVQGTWYGTGSNACLVAAPGAGFNTNLTPTGGVSLQLSSSQITLNINADGTGTGEFVELALTPLTPVSPSAYPPASGAGASSSKGTFSYTYTIADDGTLTVTFTSLDGQLLTGPSAGFAFTIVHSGGVGGPPSLTGRIGRDGKSMLLSSATPEDNADAKALSGVEETLQVKNGPSFQRICYRTRVFAPVHVDGEK